MGELCATHLDHASIFFSFIFSTRFSSVRNALFHQKSTSVQNDASCLIALFKAWKQFPISCFVAHPFERISVTDLLVAFDSFDIPTGLVLPVKSGQVQSSVRHLSTIRGIRYEQLKRCVLPHQRRIYGGRFARQKWSWQNKHFPFTKIAMLGLLVVCVKQGRFILPLFSLRRS